MEPGFLIFAIVFGILGGVPLVAGPIFWWRQPARRARRALARVPQKRLGAVAEGDRARVLGVARSEGGLTSPITGRRCIGYRVDVEEWGENEGTPSSHALDALETYGISRTDVWGRERRFRLREAWLESGDPICVLGNVSTTVDPRGEREGFRDPPRIRVIRGTAQEPTVLADELQPGLLLASG